MFDDLLGDLNEDTFGDINDLIFIDLFCFIVLVILVVILLFGLVFFDCCLEALFGGVLGLQLHRIILLLLIVLVFWRGQFPITLLIILFLLIILLLLISVFRLPFLLHLRIAGLLVAVIIEKFPIIIRLFHFLDDFLTAIVFLFFFIFCRIHCYLFLRVVFFLIYLLLLVVCDLAGSARLLGQVALFHGFRAGRLRSVLAICALNAAFLLYFFADLVEKVDKVLVLHGIVAFTPDHDIV